MNIHPRSHNQLNETTLLNLATKSTYRIPFKYLSPAESLEIVLFLIGLRDLFLLVDLLLSRLVLLVFLSLLDLSLERDLSCLERLRDLLLFLSDRVGDLLLFFLLLCLFQDLFLFSSSESELRRNCVILHDRIRNYKTAPWVDQAK